MTQMTEETRRTAHTHLARAVNLDPSDAIDLGESVAAAMPKYLAAAAGDTLGTRVLAQQLQYLDGLADPSDPVFRDAIAQLHGASHHARSPAKARSPVTEAPGTSAVDEGDAVVARMEAIRGGALASNPVAASSPSLSEAQDDGDRVVERMIALRAMPQ